MLEDDTFSLAIYAYDEKGRRTETVRRMGKLSEERMTVRYDDFDNPVEEVSQMSAASHTFSAPDSSTSTDAYRKLDRTGCLAANGAKPGRAALEHRAADDHVQRPMKRPRDRGRWRRSMAPFQTASLRQMARRRARVGPSHPRGPHPTRRLPVASQSLPNLERSQHVRPHQAGLPHRHEPRRLTGHGQQAHAVRRRETDRPSHVLTTRNGVPKLPASCQKLGRQVL